MNCEDMTRIPQLNNVLNMKAGAVGMKNTIRWIYFADCLQCVKNEYHVEDYIHGGEFVVLTNPDVTEDKNKLMALITSMVDYGIAALGINEGQILPELIEYCNKEGLPLFELPEKFPLVDLSQILCKRLVLEENNRNLEEQVFASILDAEHLNRDSRIWEEPPWKQRFIINRSGDKKYYQYGVLILFRKCACNASDWKRPCTCVNGQDK